MNVIVLIIHMSLLISDLKILFNTKKYNFGDIKVNSKVKSSCWFKFLMFVNQIVKLMVVCEPLMILVESFTVLGFQGSLCRGEYEIQYKLKFYSDCVGKGLQFDICDEYLRA